MRHVSREALALERGIEAVLLEARAMRPVPAIGLRLDQTADPGRCLSIEGVSKMSVERRHRTHRIFDQVQVVDMKNRLGEALLLRGADHQLGRRQPAVAVLTTDLSLVEAAGEWAPENLGQSRNRQQDREWVPVHEHEARIRIDGADSGEGKNVIGTFEHPAAAIIPLMLEVLQEALVKPIGVEMPGFVEPAPIARNPIRRVEAET